MAAGDKETYRNQSGDDGNSQAGGFSPAEVKSPVVKWFIAALLLTIISIGIMVFMGGGDRTHDGLIERSVCLFFTLRILGAMMTGLAFVCAWNWRPGLALGMLLTDLCITGWLAVGAFGRLLIGVSPAIQGSEFHRILIGLYLLLGVLAVGSYMVQFVLCVATLFGVGRPRRAAAPRGPHPGALALLPHLRARGYDWIRQDQCEELWRICGDGALRLPPWHEARSHGVTEGDIRSLAALVSAYGEKVSIHRPTS